MWKPKVGQTVVMAYHLTTDNKQRKTTRYRCLYRVVRVFSKDAFVANRLGTKTNVVVHRAVWAESDATPTWGVLDLQSPSEACMVDVQPSVTAQ